MQEQPDLWEGFGEPVGLVMLNIGGELGIYVETSLLGRLPLDEDNTDGLDVGRHIETSAGGS